MIFTNFFYIISKIFIMFLTCYELKSNLNAYFASLPCWHYCHEHVSTNDMPCMPLSSTVSRVELSHFYFHFLIIITCYEYILIVDSVFVTTMPLFAEKCSMMYLIFPIHLSICRIRLSTNGSIRQVK